MYTDSTGFPKSRFCSHDLFIVNKDIKYDVNLIKSLVDFQNGGSR